MPMGYAYLSGEHPQVPHEELRGSLEAEGARYRELLRLDQLVVLEVDSLAGLARAVERSAYSREGGEALAMSELGDVGPLAEGFRELRERGVARVQVRVERVKGSIEPGEAVEIQRELVKAARLAGLDVDPLAETLVKAYVSEGAVVLGLVSAKRSLGDVRARSPPNRPFWRSGELDLLLSRALVNMSRMRRGDVFLDPFCGTGTIAIEAHLIGASRALCLDADPSMVSGALANARSVGCQLLVAQEDSMAMPLRDGSVDSIATDPPYGRSTRAPGGYEAVVRGFLREAARVLREGGYVVFAGPADERPYRLALEEGFAVVARMDQFVHSGMTRQIVVAKRTA